MESGRADAESIEIGSSGLRIGVLIGLVLFTLGGGLVWLRPGSILGVYVVLGGLYMFTVVVLLHGVPFSDRGRQMLLDAPPGSAYRQK